MARLMVTLAVLMAFVALLGVGPVRADDDGDDDCAVPMADWQPRAAVEDLAQAQGWVIERLKVDDGCYQILGTTREGRAVEIKLDPATLAVVEMEDRRPGGKHGHRGRP